MGLFSIFGTGYYLMRMKRRFFRDKTLHDKKSKAVNKTSGAKGRGLNYKRFFGGKAQVGCGGRGEERAGTPLLLSSAASEGVAAHTTLASVELATAGPPAKAGDKEARGKARRFSTTSAAAKLQAGMRGYVTRKQIERSNSQKSDVTLSSSAPGDGAAPAEEAAAVTKPAAKTRRGSVPVMDNPLAGLIGVNKDLSLGPAQPGWIKNKKAMQKGGDAGGASGLSSHALLAQTEDAEIEMSGVLYKRIGEGASEGGSSVYDLIKKKAAAASVQAAITSAWQPRFFALSGGVLVYWHSEADRTQGKPASAEIELGGYEVLIDANDPNWAFELRPTIVDGRRTWYFRAETEDDRLEWAKRLVAQTYVASSTGKSGKHRILIE